MAEGDHWNGENFDLIDLLAKLRLYNNKILIEQWVGTDDKNSEENVLQVCMTAYPYRTSKLTML